MKNPIALLLGICSALLISYSTLHASMDALLADDAFSDYHGWLKYLNATEEIAIARHGATSEEVRLAKARKEEWTAGIVNNRNILSELRGAFEWAYQSQTDGSGQPFTVSIPASYNPSHSYDLVVDLHGSGNDHVRDSTWMTEDDGNIALAPFGRSSGGGYLNLSEADVLDAISYVKAHWNINPRRIYIRGSSMGAYGSFRLTNRYPHLFAAALPAAGSGLHYPVENWMHMPMYCTHSTDDHVVPIVMSRLPAQALRAINHNVIIEDIEGWGHSAWDYLVSTGRKPTQWAKAFATPLMNEVTCIDYTASDGVARRGYWAEIMEWGPKSTPARFRLYVKDGNTIDVRLDNIDKLRIDLEESPLDTGVELMISINGDSPRHIPSPLPGKLFVTREGDTYACSSTPPVEPPYKIHHPGGARNLYSGEPLLVVWGTQGDDARDRLLEEAALALRSSPHPYVPTDLSPDPKGYTKFAMRYGLLNGKPDYQVSDEDMQRFHLVIVGNTSENSVAARLAARLPVRSIYSWVLASDGVWWSVNLPVMFLCHYNPIAPQKLIYWISSKHPDFYKDGAFLSEWTTPTYHMSGGTSILGGRDFTLYDWQTASMVASRNFDSNWNWEPGYSESERIREIDSTYRGVAELEGTAVRNATGADFSLINWYEFNIDHRVVPGISRYMDLAPDMNSRKIGLMEMSGAQLLDYKRVCDSIQSGWGRFDITGKTSFVNIKNEAVYRVCLDPAAFQALISIVGSLPDSLRYSEVSMEDAFNALIRTRP